MHSARRCTLLRGPFCSGTALLDAAARAIQISRGWASAKLPDSGGGRAASGREVEADSGPATPEQQSLLQGLAAAPVLAEVERMRKEHSVLPYHQLQQSAAAARCVECCMLGCRTD